MFGGNIFYLNIIFYIKKETTNIFDIIILKYLLVFLYTSGSKTYKLQAAWYWSENHIGNIKYYE